MVLRSGFEAFAFRFLEAIPFVEKKRRKKEKKRKKSMAEYDAMAIVIQHSTDEQSDGYIHQHWTTVTTEDPRNPLHAHPWRAFEDTSRGPSGFFTHSLTHTMAYGRLLIMDLTILLQYEIPD